MKYLLLALSLLVASLPAAMADEFFPVFVNGQPAATTPLLGGEKVPIIQSGITKTLPPYILIGSQAIPLGGSAPSQGTGNKVQLASGSFVNGHCLQYAADDPHGKRSPARKIICPLSSFGWNAARKRIG